MEIRHGTVIEYDPQKSTFVHLFHNERPETNVDEIIRKVKVKGLKRGNVNYRALPMKNDSVFITGASELDGDLALSNPHTIVDLPRLFREGFEIYEANHDISDEVFHATKKNLTNPRWLKEMQDRYHMRRVRSVADLTKVRVTFHAPSMDSYMYGCRSFRRVYEPFTPEILVKQDIPLKYLLGFRDY